MNTFTRFAAAALLAALLTIGVTAHDDAPPCTPDEVRAALEKPELLHIMLQYVQFGTYYPADRSVHLPDLVVCYELAQFYRATVVYLVYTSLEPRGVVAPPDLGDSLLRARRKVEAIAAEATPQPPQVDDLLPTLEPVLK